MGPFSATYSTKEFCHPCPTPPVSVPRSMPSLKGFAWAAKFGFLKDHRLPAMFAWRVGQTCSLLACDSCIVVQWTVETLQCTCNHTCRVECGMHFIALARPFESLAGSTWPSGEAIESSPCWTWIYFCFGFNASTRPRCLGWQQGVKQKAKLGIGLQFSFWKKRKARIGLRS